MTKEKIDFTIPKHYDLSMTCHAHGWMNLAPFRWNADSKTLHFSIFVDDAPIDIETCQIGGKIAASLISHLKLSEDQIDFAKKMIVRSLDLNASTDALLEIAERVGQNYVDIIKKGAGRLLHSPTLWEDAAKTLFTTNCTWNLTQKMCDAVCSERFSKAAPSGSFPFPPPQTIAEYTPEQIRKLMPIGYRAEYLIPLAQRFKEDPFLSAIETNGYNYKTADKLVRSLRGFGDYGVAHLLILSGYFNEIPIDTVVVSYLKQNHRVRKPKSFIDRTYRKWKEYKWWGLKLEKIISQQNWLGD
jgi:N-glycosylase/DNA lyase